MCQNQTNAPSPVPMKELSKMTTDDDKDTSIAEVHNDASDQGRPTSFPQKLYEMLDRSCQDGFEDIVSWQPNGMGFVVHQLQKFSDDIMPRFFTFHNKLSTFHMMLRRYGFISSANGYHHHKLFVRDRPDLITHIDANNKMKTKKSFVDNLKESKARAKEDEEEVPETSSITAATSCCDCCDSDHDEESGLAVLDEEEIPEDTTTTTTSSLGDDHHGLVNQASTSISRASNSLFQELLCDFAMNLDGLAPPLLPQETQSSLSSAPVTTKRSVVTTSFPMMKRRGPLQTPGRLRNAFALDSIIPSQARQTVTQAGVVKAIALDLTARNEVEKEESKRFQKPLFLNEISCDEINHIQWGTSPTEAISSSSSTVATAESTPFPSPLSPALEELI